MTNAGRTRRALFVVAIAGVGAWLSVAGCDDTGSYIFTGEQYDPVLQCLEPVSSIDIIAGSPPGSCGPVCILSEPQDGGQVAYVSTMCGPYPNYPFELDAGSDPQCVAALAAFARNALCEDGGVVILGDAGTDAGSDAGGGADAQTSDTGAAGADATSSDATPGSDATSDATSGSDATAD